MPAYDYRCRDCGHEFEIHQSFSDDALTECPKCGGNLRKVFGNVGISFKGSGFYKNDSRSGASASSSSSRSSSDSASSTTSSASDSSSGTATSSSDSSSGSSSKESSTAGSAA